MDCRSSNTFAKALVQFGGDKRVSVGNSHFVIEALADPGSGEIIVGASESYIAGGALAALITTLQQRFPRFRVVVVESNTAAMSFADLRERHVDVMFGRSTRADPPADIERIHLLDESLLLVAGGQNAWAHALTMRFADLATRP